MNKQYNENTDMKILYKDFIKCYHHPVNKDMRNIEIYAMDVFKAYLHIVGEKFSSYGDVYADTLNCRYYILYTNDKNKFDNIFKYIRNSKKKCKIVLMLSGEFTELNTAERFKTLKFSELYNNMSAEKLNNAELDVNWLRLHGFFD